jgi:hypothetical protein
MNCPPELRTRYQEERVIPFIGAGVSMSVAWKSGGEKRRGPSWSEFVAQATRMLGFADPELARVRGTDLQILEYFKRKKNDQIAELTNWFIDRMKPPDAALKVSPIHQELEQLAKCHLFYTTNYDDFLERSFRLNGRHHQVVAVESQMGGVRRDCEIIKFHGDLNHPDQIVLTESDYETRLSLSTAMDYRLRADLLGHVVLFIGYSFRDPNVSYLFRLFIDHFEDKAGTLPGPRGWIVVPDPSDFERELFRARHMSVIPVDGADITTGIVSLLRDMRS